MLKIAPALAAALGCCLAMSASSPGQAMPAPATKAPAASACKDDAGWEDPAEPFRIYGNAWFVGTCGISSILLVSPDGDILIDGGTKNDAPLIEANIQRLGFRIQDIRYILSSHAHLDHAGGIAQLQRDSDAEVISRGADAAALARGRGDRGDPQFLSIDGFAPVARVVAFEDGQTLRLGGIAVTAHATPGHTPGSTSWTWTSSEGSQRLNLAYVDSLSAVSDDAYRFSDAAAHPGALARMRSSIATVADLPCDILLTPHPGASGMWSRFGPRASSPPVDPTACRKLAERSGAALDARLAKESQAGVR